MLKNVLREKLVECLRKAQANVQDLHRIILIQASFEAIQELLDEYSNMRVSRRSIFRGNALDRCTCQVRKCFVDVTYGYPVFTSLDKIIEGTMNAISDDGNE